MDQMSRITPIAAIPAPDVPLTRAGKAALYVGACAVAFLDSAQGKVVVIPPWCKTNGFVTENDGDILFSFRVDTTKLPA